MNHAGALAPCVVDWRTGLPRSSRCRSTTPCCFHTGAGGDFESLVAPAARRALRPRRLGLRAMDIGPPGSRCRPACPPRCPGRLRGGAPAIERSRRHEPPLACPPRLGPFRSRGWLAIVNAPGSNRAAIDPADDPLLAPPLYGRWHAARRNRRTRLGMMRLDELNLDPRHRAAAAFGTRVVQEHQEALMAAAWEQAGDLQRANQRLRPTATERRGRRQPARETLLAPGRREPRCG